MERVQGGTDLFRFASARFADSHGGEATQTVKRNLLRLLARLVSRLHGKGVFHRDLKAANVLVSEDGLGPRVVLLDLDAVRFKRAVSRKDRVLNLAQLDASVPECVTIRDRMRFLLVYADHAVDRAALRDLARDVRRLSLVRRGIRE
jgi:serine/threonine protein kinase